MMKLQELTEYINKHIPLTYHLGAKITYYDGEMLEVIAPLEPNLNHRNTAFGGSISALGILSGWGLLFIKLKENNLKTRLVIQKSSLDFIEPIDAAFKASCIAPNDYEWSKFIKTIKKHGKARIRVESKITSSHNNGGDHSGTYVAILQK